jgi:hypothetical protein
MKYSSATSELSSGFGQLECQLDELHHDASDSGITALPSPLTVTNLPAINITSSQLP